MLRVYAFQILGFDTTGHPVTPVTQATAAVDSVTGVIGRRERLGWEDITKSSAKVISFIGKSRVCPSKRKYLIR